MIITIMLLSLAATNGIVEIYLHRFIAYIENTSISYSMHVYNSLSDVRSHPANTEATFLRSAPTHSNRCECVNKQTFHRSTHISRDIVRIGTNVCCVLCGPGCFHARMTTQPKLCYYTSCALAQHRQNIYRTENKHAHIDKRRTHTHTTAMGIFSSTTTTVVNVCVSVCVDYIPAYTCRQTH